MQACVEAAQIVRRHDEAGGVFVHCFPIRVERGVLGVLEVICAAPLDDDDLGTAEGFLGLYRNYLNLLDYSERDTLTGLRNRKTFDENIGKILGNIARPTDDDKRRRRPEDSHQHWLAVVDVDHFKRVNDQFGHLYGDEVLLLLARIMRQSFRQQDKLFRFGGEEFVVVLRAATEAEVHRALERFRRAVEDYNFPQIGRVTASIGYTMIKPEDTIPEIVGRADDALYVAKENGRNQLANYETLLAEGMISVREQPSGDIELF
jgi:diguanylate cyclase (GGDEF)-like protein